MRFGAIAAARRQPLPVFERATGRQVFASRFLWNSYFLSRLCVSKFYAPRFIQGAVAPKSEVSMLDVMFIAIGLGFLAGAMLYAVACDRL